MEEFKIITTRPIIEGNYNPEEEYALASGNGDMKGTPPKNQDYKLENAMANIKNSNVTTSTGTRQNKLFDAWRSNKSDRQNNRQTKRDARKDNRKARKANRNAKALKRITDKNGKPVFGYKLSKVFGRKKQNQDGTTTDLKSTEIILDSQGNAYDANEVSKATGVAKSKLTSSTVDAMLVKAKNKTTGETEAFVPVADSNVTQASDDQFYLTQETVGANEPIQDEKKKDEEKAKQETGMKKSTKIILIASGLVVASLIVYAIVKSKPTAPTTTK
jgi:hypothetical protein